MTLLSSARIVRKLGLEHGMRFLLGRVHVGTPDDTIRADFERWVKTAEAKAPGATGLTPEALTDAVVTYALAVHRHNGRTYRRVMKGEVR